MAVLPWFFNGSSKDCRPYLLISNFARGRDIMIENEEAVLIAAGALWDVVTNTMWWLAGMKPWWRHSPHSNYFNLFYLTLDSLTPTNNNNLK